MSAVARKRSCHRHHDAPYVVSCAECGFPLCDACWTHSSNGSPWCVTCSTEVTTRSFRRWSWALTFFLLLAGVAVVGWRADAFDHAYGLIAFGALGGTGVLLYLVSRAVSSGPAHPVSLRRLEGLPPERPVAAAHPYRARLRQAGMRVVPRVSGKVATLFALVSLGLCAVLFPTVLKLPRWVEAEVVLGAWWAALALVLGVLLYRGIKVADDFRFRLNPFGQRDKGSSSLWSDLPGCVDVGTVDAEGCLVVLGVAVVLAALAGASFLVAEVVLPMVFMGCYWLLHRAIGRVANDRHGCEGNLARASLWGALWATLYVAPLALAVWGLHRGWPR
ncbi:MAG TPA: hypothetical protein VFS00_20720 [Polyangiaceae bacterium]|nr:hypothetical protein [Polyangiaceae bacterium]